MHALVKDTKEANWLDDTFGETVMLKFQLAHVHQTTYPHRDNNGTDTHIKLLCGMVLAATWSQADGDAHGLTDAVEIEKLKDTCDLVDWERLSQMPSGRVFLLRKGDDVLVMPSGTYHYVYTVRTKVAIAGDFTLAHRASAGSSAWDASRSLVRRTPSIGAATIGISTEAR
jgi:hypothetical protein